MATTSLTDVSYYVRKFYPFAILGVIVILILYYAVRLSILYVESTRVIPVSTNTVFGKIKKPYLLEASPSAGLKFKLDTIEGVPTTATATAKVFFLPPPQVRFGYKEKVFLIAKTLGFDTEATNSYRLVNNQAIFNEPNQKLLIDIRNFNISYRYFFENDKTLINQAMTPESQESQTKAVDFLQSIGAYPQELAQGNTNIIFFRLNPNTKLLSQLKDNIKANLVEVDFYRPDIDGLPVLSPKYFNSQHYVLMLFTKDGRSKILRSDLRFFEKSAEQVGTYPLKTGEEAYAELTGGKGMVVSNPQGKKNVVIRKMLVGYLDPDTYQDYMEPVYVFLGDGDFVAYVPALSNEFLTD